MQAALFAFSVLLFLAAGAWFWGPRFAGVLLLVVGIHEAGHYLAMRAFGYRNVQMLALPLVGGVTMGFEARPDAARRAWMSLMGPLPGILIGWALAIWYVQDPAGRDSLLFLAAFVFLFVNYLNVVPLPPLDGAHVVQALLPASAQRLAAVFIGVACLAGGALALWLGLYLLTILAVLQLPQALARWRLADVLAKLRKDPEMDKSRPLAARRQRVFAVYDEVAGPAPQAPARLGQGTEALRTLDTVPMRRGQQLLIGGVYLLLLAGPLLAGVLAVLYLRHNSQAGDYVGQAQAAYARAEARWRAEAAALPLPVLLADVRQSLAQEGEALPPLPPPASEAALAEAAQRLGSPLPDDLLAFYRLADGDPVLGLHPLAQLRPADEALPGEDAAMPAAGAPPGITPAGTGAAPKQVSEAVPGLLSLGGAEGETTLLYDIGAVPKLMGHRLFERVGDDGVATLQRDLRSWLESRWALARQLAQFQEQQRAMEARGAQEIAGWSRQQLIEALAERPPLERLLGRGNLPGPATPAALVAAAELGGQALPAGLAALYAQHDGFPPLQLLPLREWRRVDSLGARYVAQVHGYLEGVYAQYPLLDRQSPDACLSIGGLTAGDEVHRLFLFWCPQNPAAQQLIGETAVADVDDLLRSQLARQRAWQQQAP